MAKLERGKSGISIYRKFNGIKYHWTGNIYISKTEAQRAAHDYAKGRGTFARIIKLSKGYVIYARHQGIF